MKTEKKVFICSNSEYLNTYLLNKLVKNFILNKNNKYIYGRSKYDVNTKIVGFNNFNSAIDNCELLFNQENLILIVINSFYFEKSLNFILQLLEINKNIVLCLIKDRRVLININLLQRYFDINVFEINLEEFDDELFYNQISNEHVSTYSILYNDVEKEISNLYELLPSLESKKYILLKLLEGDKNIVKNSNENVLTVEVNEYLRETNFEKNCELINKKINSVSEFVSYQAIRYFDTKKDSLINKFIILPVVMINLFLKIFIISFAFKELYFNLFKLNIYITAILLFISYFIFNLILFIKKILLKESKYYYSIILNTDWMFNIFSTSSEKMLKIFSSLDIFNVLTLLILLMHGYMKTLDLSFLLYLIYFLGIIIYLTSNKILVELDYFKQKKLFVSIEYIKKIRFWEITYYFIKLNLIDILKKSSLMTIIVLLTKWFLSFCK